MAFWLRLLLVDFSVVLVYQYLTYWRFVSLFDFIKRGNRVVGRGYLISLLSPWPHPVIPSLLLNIKRCVMFNVVLCSTFFSDLRSDFQWLVIIMITHQKCGIQVFCWLPLLILDCDITLWSADFRYFVEPQPPPLWSLTAISHTKVWNSGRFHWRRKCIYSGLVRPSIGLHSMEFPPFVFGCDITLRYM